MCIRDSLACGIGVLVTYSLLFPMAYEAFRGITNLDKYLSEDNNDDILDMLIEA